MKRRDFLAKGTAAGVLATSSDFLPPLHAQSGPQQTAEDFLPKPAVARKVVSPSGVAISPMPLAERIRRKIVPRRGFCSIAPAADALLLSGNGAVTIETHCDPYSDQVVFRHESLFAPRRRPFEAPNIAGIFPQVRQMLLDGKYHDAARLGYEEWRKTPISRGMGFGGGAAFSMRLEYPKTASVTNYLRTVDFESTELKVYWTDERGEWVRQLVASRPDNVVVQWLTAPKGQPLNVRRRVKVFKLPDSNIEAVHRDALDSGRVGGP